jgi:hypothetical protein
MQRKSAFNLPEIYFSIVLLHKTSVVHLLLCNKIYFTDYFHVFGVDELKGAIRKAP